MNHLDPEKQLRPSEGQCKLIVVQDQLQVCPYLESTTARMPLRLPVGDVTPQITDQLLAAGYRRSGDFVYRTQCPSCTECKPTRIEVSQFKMTGSMRRVLKRGDRDLSITWAAPVITQPRIDMFNRHRGERSLGNGERVDASSYGAFLVDSCCDTQELSVFLQDQLIAVAVIDVGETSISAVYTHFDPDHARYSLGTYAILKQIQWAQEMGRTYVYLGMYVADNSHLNYKARFGPQQRLCDGQWTDIQQA